MARLDVDLAAVDRAATCVRAVYDGLGRVPGLPRETAQMAGHAQLAGALDRLSDVWDRAYDTVSEDISRVSDALAAFRDTFAALDAELAQRANGGTLGVSR